MRKSDLDTIFDHNGISFQYDKKTNELFVNDKRVVTETKFQIDEKILAWVVTFSVLGQTIISLLTYLNCE